MALAAPSSNPVFLALSGLASGRKGITPAYGEALAEAASVCLEERGHSSPTRMQISGAIQTPAELDWTNPSAQARRCWNDDGYATEHGAYGIATLLAEQCGLEVVLRSKKKTGFDFWVAPPNFEITLFQGLTRLEVSGIRNGDRSKVDSRVREKLKQTDPSDGTLPAIVIVVEFGSPFAKVAEK